MKCFRIPSALVVALTVACTAAPSGAASITYVDADFESNTTLADGTAMNLVADEAAVSNGMGNPEDYYITAGTVNTTGNAPSNWGERTVGGVNGGNVLVGPQTGAGDAPELVTTIGGLAPGSSYELYAYYWVIGQPGALNAAEWQLAAGFASGSLTTYDSDGVGGVAGTSPSPGDFANMVVVSNAPDNSLTMLQASLGVAVADAGGEVKVFVDDISDDTQRTWYDGLGYELAIPEPMTATMSLLAGLALAARARVR